MTALRFGFWFFWYRIVPREILFYFKILYFKILDSFSVPIIVRTFFSPWKRDEVFVKNAPLNVRIYVWASNQVSRLIGVVLRSAVLFIFAVVMVLWGLVFVGVFCFWLLYPVLVLFLALAAVFYLTKGFHAV